MTARASRLVLTLAAIAVAFAAADTYVVVLALPDMMGDVGIPIDQLQRAAPIVSGFLLGYVAMLPLIGRIADLRGRVPVLVAALVLFAVGSLVTTLAYDMPSLVGGRFLQGVGGGGLVGDDVPVGSGPASHASASPTSLNDWRHSKRPLRPFPTFRRGLRDRHTGSSRCSLPRSHSRSSHEMA